MYKYLVILSMFSACGYYPEDNIVEESIEKAIDEEFHYDLDLSPLSPKPHV